MSLERIKEEERQEYTKQRAIVEEKLFEAMKYEKILHELQHNDITCEKYN